LGPFLLDANVLIALAFLCMSSTTEWAGGFRAIPGRMGDLSVHRGRFRESLEQFGVLSRRADAQ